MDKETQVISNWEGWIIDEKYKKILSGMTQFYINVSPEEAFTDYFTPHDYSHCKAVEKLAKAIINKSGIRSNLSDTEMFILFSCVWTHDLGMMTGIAKKVLGKENYKVETKREKHEIISAIYLCNDKDSLDIFKQGGIEESSASSFLNTIGLINKFHRRKYKLNLCPIERYIKGERVRSRLIASIVRFADTLHIDTTRYDRNRFNILQIGNFDRTSRLHWLKSYVVSSVFLDITKQTIFITMDLPEIENQTPKELEENADNLKSIVYEDVFEDVTALQDVFREHGFQFYSIVDIKINFIPGIGENNAQEIIGIINDLHIVLSPNNSKVLRKALDSIKALSEITFNSYELFYNQLQQLLKHLDGILNDRPCHVGLSKIIQKTKEAYKSFPDKDADLDKEQISSHQNFLKKMVFDINNERTDSLKKIQGKACDILKKRKNIILFGTSELVLNFLDSLSNSIRQELQFYIFECGSKRKFSPSNNLEYNDGIGYALLLSAKGFKKIHILPDNSFCSLVDDKSKNITKDNTLILFGANGVEQGTNDCGHSSGHKAMAILAKHYEIPVYVISDSFKVGEIKWDATLQRRGDWLTGQKKWLDELKNKNISLLNYREDKIPRKLIQEVITGE